MKKILSFVAAVLLAGEAFAAVLQVENGAGVSNITSTSAWITASVVTTNAINPFLFSYWSTNNSATNLTWRFTNSYGQQAIGNYSVKALSLSPSTLYYYRTRGTNTAEGSWATLSGSFRTLTPSTSAPPSSVRAVMVDTNGVLKWPTNSTFFAMNTNRYYLDTTNKIWEVWDATSRVIYCQVRGAITTNVTIFATP